MTAGSIPISFEVNLLVRLHRQYGEESYVYSGAPEFVIQEDQFPTCVQEQEGQLSLFGRSPQGPPASQTSHNIW